MKQRNIVVSPPFLLALLCVGMTFFLHCSKPTEPPKPTPADVDPSKYGLSALCPGAKGCSKAEGKLQAGASAVSLSPKAYEVARFSYLNEKGFCPSPTPLSPYGLKRCGKLVERAIYGRSDCGTDGICKGDKIKTRIECSESKACPNDKLTCDTKAKRCILAYPGPDADGSEKDGMPDWFLDCGSDRICPCIEPNGQPAYFGKDKKTCLKGHKPNPNYKKPDEDGSEGNGKFEGYWMAGFHGNHPMQGKNDDIWARTLVLQTGDVTVAIVSVDLVGYFRSNVENVRKLVKEALPKQEIDYILISATHVHEAPDMIGQWGQQQAGIPIKSGVNPEYSKKVEMLIAKSIQQAFEQRKPAKIKAGKIKTGRQGFLRDSRDPQVFDDELHVLHITQADDDSTISVLVNWGNHPEVLSDINNYLTSDFPHYVREALEKGIKKTSKTPEYKGLGGVAIYLQGAVGGLMTPLRIEIPDLEGVPQSRSDWNKSRALGYQLAVKAHKALKKAETLSDSKLALWAKTTQIPIENKLFQVAFKLGIFDRKPKGYDPSIPITEDNLPKITTEISVIRLGELTFFSMPGELDPEILVGGYDGSHSYGADLIDPKNSHPPDLSKAPKGPYLKERIPGKYKLFVGLGNDFLGYIVASWNYKLAEKNPYFKQAEGDHYEETNSIGPSTTPTLLKLYDQLLPYTQKLGPPSP